MRRIFRKGRYANVTATLALMIALGGTSYAAITLEPNSVGSRQIVRGGVAASDIRRNAVNSTKVKNGSLKSEDFAAGQIPAGPAGPAGPQGPAGAAGAAGATGPAGPVNLVYLAEDFDVSGTSQATGHVSCPAGMVAISAGADGWDASFDDELMVNSIRIEDGGGGVPDTAHVTMYNNTGSTLTATAQVVCATATSIDQSAFFTKAKAAE